MRSLIWHKEVEEHCYPVKAKSASVQNAVEADAPIGREPSSTQLVLEADFQLERKLKNQERMRRIGGEDEQLMHNKRGTLLCYGFQTGKCKDSTPDVSGKRFVPNVCCQCMGHGSARRPAQSSRGLTTVSGVAKDLVRC